MQKEWENRETKEKVDGRKSSIWVQHPKEDKKFGVYSVSKPRQKREGKPKGKPHPFTMTGTPSSLYAWISRFLNCIISGFFSYKVKTFCSSHFKLLSTISKSNSMTILASMSRISA